MFGSPHNNLLLASKPRLSPFSLSFLNDLHPSSDPSVRPSIQLSSAQLSSMTTKGHIFPPVIYLNPPASLYLLSWRSWWGFDGAFRKTGGGDRPLLQYVCVCVCIHEHVELHASLNVDGLSRNTHRAATMPSSSRQQQSEVRLLGLSVCSEEASVKDSKLCVCALLVQLS